MENHQGLRATEGRPCQRQQERGKTEREASGYTGPADTSVLDVQPSELQEKKFLLFEPQCVVFCYW